MEAKIENVKDVAGTVRNSGRHAHYQQLIRYETDAGFVAGVVWFRFLCVQSTSFLSTSDPLATPRIILCSSTTIYGLDFPHCTHVFITARLKDVREYVHVSGRTGRAGRDGMVIQLVFPEELSRSVQQRQVRGWKLRCGLDLISFVNCAFVVVDCALSVVSCLVLSNNDSFLITNLWRDRSRKPAKMTTCCTLTCFHIEQSVDC